MTHTIRIAFAATLAAAPLAALAQSTDSAESRDTERVEIKRASTWGFSEEVRQYLSKAYEDLYAKPESAVEDLQIAVGMSEILAAASSSAEGEELMQAAQELSRFAQRVQLRQEVNPEELSRPGAAVTLAIAKVQFAEAQKGLERGDESMVAYSLGSAADNLLQTHIYLKQAPGEDAAKAIYNADRLANQIKTLIEPTTQQGGQYAVTTPEEKSDTEDIQLLDADAQTAGGQMGVASQIPQVAPEIMQALGDAIDDADGALQK